MIALTGHSSASSQTMSSTTSPFNSFGATILLVVYNTQSSTTPGTCTIVDTYGNNWTQLSGTSSGDGMNTGFFACGLAGDTVVTGPGHTVTVSGDAMSLSFCAFSGTVPYLSPELVFINTNNINPPPSATNDTAIDFTSTPGATNDMLYWGFMNDGSFGDSPFSIASPFAIIDAVPTSVNFLQDVSGFPGIVTFYFVQSTLAPVACNLTLSVPALSFVLGTATPPDAAPVPTTPQMLSPTGTGFGYSTMPFVLEPCHKGGSRG